MESKGFLGIEYINFLNKAIPLLIIENLMAKFNFEFNTR